MKFDRNRIYVLDDFLPKSYQDKIEFAFFNKVRFQFTPNLAGLQPNQNPMDFEQNFEMGFGSTMGINNSQETEFMFYYFFPIFEIGFAQLGLNIDTFKTTRCFLSYPSERNADRTFPHVDDHSAHLVGLYYIRDSDGDTVIFNESNFTGRGDAINPNELTVKERVTPKKGRLVIFDGSYLHRSTPPKNNVRGIINTNVLISG